MIRYNSILEQGLIPIGDALLGTEYITSLRKWRRIQNLSEGELQNLAQIKKSKILKHATENIPFYRDVILKGKEHELCDFPILTKHIIRDNMDKLLWHPEKKHSLITEKSSGSSGVQGQVYMSKKEQSNVQAIQTLLWEWSGYRLGESLLQTGMTLQRGFVKSAKDFLFRTRYHSAFGLDENDVLDRLRTLQTQPTSFFGGYASSLYIYALVANKNNIKDVKFKSVISWGDKMFPHYRSMIESQFNTKVYDTYGTTEGFMIAGQKDIEHYYIISPHVWVELVDDNGHEVPDGEVGHVLVTSLDAFEMPLIRYRLGDLAMKLPPNEYPKNRELNFPMLKFIVGRDTDIVRTSSGKSMIVHFFTGIFEHYSSIEQFRVIQDNLDGITIEFIPQIGFKDDVLESIRTAIHFRLEEEFSISFRKVKTIPSSPSGKPQIIVSTINKGNAN